MTITRRFRAIVLTDTAPEDDQVIWSHNGHLLYKNRQIWKPLHKVLANEVVYYDVKNNQEVSVKFALDNITEMIKSDITTEYVKTTDKIPVAGGPLAEALNKGGITEIPSGTDLQTVLTEWCAKELWSEAPVFTEGTITASMPNPTLTLNQTGLVEVGTIISMSATTIKESTYKTSDRTYTGIKYGYSSQNNNTVEHTDNTISIAPTGAAAMGDKYSLVRTINNVTEKTVEGNSSISIPANTFTAKEGVNTVTAACTGVRYKCTFAEIPKYYLCSNFGNTNEEHVTQPKESVEIISNTPAGNTSITVTGVYPYFATTQSISSMSKLALTVSKSIEVSMPAEDENNKHSFMIPAKFNVTKIQLFNTVSNKYEDYSIDKFTVTTVTQEVQGVQVEYKRYSRNSGINGPNKFTFTIA